MTGQDVVCPNCGEQGFDGQGSVTVGGTPMYLRVCWSCGTRFACEDKPDITEERTNHPGINDYIEVQAYARRREELARKRGRKNAETDHS